MAADTTPYRMSAPYWLVWAVFVCHSSLTAVFSQKIKPVDKHSVLCARKGAAQSAFTTDILPVFFLLIRKEEELDCELGHLKKLP